jgi:hypothetical protein
MMRLKVYKSKKTWLAKSWRLATVRTARVGDRGLVAKWTARVSINYSGFWPSCAHSWLWQSVVQLDSCATVAGVLAYDHPGLGSTYYLIFHQTILIPCMKSSLISLMQLLDHDLYVNDVPKYMALTPTVNHHCIIIPEWPDTEALWIPLLIYGVLSYFVTCKPTKEEYERSDLDLRIEMLYELPKWDPLDKRFATAKRSMLDSNGMLQEEQDKPSCRILSTVTSAHEGCDKDFGNTIENNTITTYKMSTVKSARSRKVSPPLVPESLQKDGTFDMMQPPGLLKPPRKRPSTQPYTPHYRANFARATDNCNIEG